MLVAILDSGISADHPHIGNVVEGVAISSQGISADCIDWIGHGTAVAAVIHEKAPGAGLFIVKIFGRRLATNIDQLVAGIEWSIERGANLINLSLGTTNASHRHRLQSCVEHANRSGCKLISARMVNNQPCFPGAMPGVLGVDADASIERDKMRYSANGAVASPYPRPIPGVPPERNLHGVSFAVANVTGILCAQAFRDSVA